MSALNGLSRLLYRLARLTRDARAVQRSFQTGSLTPLAKRLARKAAGRGYGSLTGRWLR